MLREGSAAMVLALALGCARPHPAAPESPAAMPPRAGPLAPSPAAVRLASQLGLPEGALDRLARGEIVTRDLPADSETELALAAAVLIPAPVGKVAAFFENGNGFSTNPQALGHGPIDPQAPAAGLAGLAFDPAESAEAARLLRADSEVNLSAAEAARLKGQERPTAPAALAAAATAAMQQILKERLEAYRAAGPAGIAPYARGQGHESSPGKPMLTPTAAEFALWDDHAPLIAPADAPAVPQRSWWVKSRVQGRPELDLVQTTVAPLPDRTVYQERHIYVLHSYNAEQDTLALVPSGEGTLVFATYRTWTDELTGIGGALRRAIAQGRFRDQISASLDRLRTAAAAK